MKLLKDKWKILGECFLLFQKDLGDIFIFSFIFNIKFEKDPVSMFLKKIKNIIFIVILSYGCNYNNSNNKEINVIDGDTFFLN